MGIMKRLAVYCRSTGRKEDALGSQSGICLEAIKQNPEWELKEIYGDFETDGCLQGSRPHFHRMLKDCENEEIDIVMVNSTSRFHKDPKKAVECIWHLMDLGIRVILKTGNIDTANWMTPVLLTVMYVLADEEESEDK